MPHTENPSRDSEFRLNQTYALVLDPSSLLSSDPCDDGTVAAADRFHDNILCGVVLNHTQHSPECL